MPPEKDSGPGQPALDPKDYPGPAGVIASSLSMNRDAAGSRTETPINKARGAVISPLPPRQPSIETIMKHFFAPARIAPRLADTIGTNWIADRQAAAEEKRRAADQCSADAIAKWLEANSPTICKPSRKDTPHYKSEALKSNIKNITPMPASKAAKKHEDTKNQTPTMGVLSTGDEVLDLLVSAVRSEQIEQERAAEKISEARGRIEADLNRTWKQEPAREDQGAGYRPFDPAAAASARAAWATNGFKYDPATEAAAALDGVDGLDDEGGGTDPDCLPEGGGSGYLADKGQDLELLDQGAGDYGSAPIDDSWVALEEELEDSEDDDADDDDDEEPPYDEKDGRDDPLDNRKYLRALETSQTEDERVKPATRRGHSQEAGQTFGDTVSGYSIIKRSHSRSSLTTAGAGMRGHTTQDALIKRRNEEANKLLQAADRATKVPENIEELTLAKNKQKGVRAIRKNPELMNSGMRAAPGAWPPPAGLQQGHQGRCGSRVADYSGVRTGRRTGKGSSSWVA